MKRNAFTTAGAAAVAAAVTAASILLPQQILELNFSEREEFAFK